MVRTSSGQIIYKSKNYRKRHRPKEFRIKVSFYQKIGNLKKLKILIVIFLTIFLIFAAGIWGFVFRGLPTPDDLINRKISLTTSIYDRNGILLYQIFKDENRTLVPLDQVPQHMRFATIASEDASFYSNHGFSIKGILRALFNNTKNGGIVEGGSTITQQLVKNTLLSPDKTILRKIKELILSIQVESRFPKAKILEMYLNEIPYGGTAYGIEAASEQYFSKDVSQLTLGEVALLAGLTKSPTTYSPFGEHPELAILRQKEVLKRMFENGFITKDQEVQAENENLNFVNKDKIKAPHFVMYVRQKLVDSFGEDVVTAGGLNVVTTLDLNIQKIAEEVVKSNVEKLYGLHVTNGSAIVMDPVTGEILAMVGSKDYFDIKNNGNVNVTIALRPPGSSIKIVNYAYALSHGFTPATILMDTPVSFKSPFSPSYTPINYDGKFVGPLTLREAFSQSRNIPAVKVLASYGVDKMIEMGKEMGITTWTEKNTYGLSLTLGGGATRLIDLARVYATLANYGERVPIKSILKVDDSKGNNLPIDCDTGNCKEEQVLDERVAYQIIDILKDNNARASEFGFHSALVLHNHPEVAVKTGTSNDLRDNLTIGFNQKYLTAVWVGNNDNTPMSRIASGITGAAPIWNEIMTRLLANESPGEWRIPGGLTQAKICRLTGTLSCSDCPTQNEWFLNGTQPTKACNNDLIKQLEFVNNQNHEDKENSRP